MNRQMRAGGEQTFNNNKNGTGKVWICNKTRIQIIAYSPALLHATKHPKNPLEEEDLFRSYYRRPSRHATRPRLPRPASLARRLLPCVRLLPGRLGGLEEVLPQERRGPLRAGPLSSEQQRGGSCFLSPRPGGLLAHTHSPGLHATENEPRWLEGWDLGPNGWGAAREAAVVPAPHPMRISPQPDDSAKKRIIAPTLSPTSSARREGS